MTTSGNLIVNVSGFKNNIGSVKGNLFQPNDNIMLMKKAFKHANASIIDQKAKIIFPDIEFGTYAVSVFHDETNVGYLQHKLGFPVDPLGFSNDFQLSITTGKPSFEKLKFEFQSNNQEIHIVVKKILPMI